MTAVEKARELLTLDKLPLPEGVPIDRIEVEDYVDWSGDASLRVTIYLGESVEMDHSTLDKLIPFKRTVQDVSFSVEPERFPYVRLVKQSELDAAEREAAAEEEELERQYGKANGVESDAR